MTQDNKIISIAGIVFGFELLFYKPIENIHIDIRKNLRGQISNGQASSMKQIRTTALIALNYFFKKPDHIWIPNPFSQNGKQNVVINTIEKFRNIAFLRPSMEATARLWTFSMSAPE